MALQILAAWGSLGDLLKQIAGSYSVSLDMQNVWGGGALDITYEMHL